MHKTLLKWFQKHQSGEIASALEYYQTHIEQYPNDINAWQLLGIGYSQLHAYDDALFAYKKGLSLDPDNITLHSNIGHVYIKLEQYDLSQMHFNTVLSKQPGHLGVLKNLGLLHYKKGEYDQAEAYFLKALAIDEHNEMLLHNLGLCQFNQKQLKPAIRSFQSALNVNPNNDAIMVNLAESYLQQSNYFDAIKYFKKALAIEPSFRIHHGLGCAYLGHDEADKALVSFNKAYELEPFNFENCHNLASLYFHQQKLGEALQCWFQCLQMKKDCQQTLYNIGVCYQHQNKFEDASSYFHKVLTHNTNHADSLHNLGTLALKQNKPKEAIGFYQRVLKIKPDNVQVKFLLQALENSSKPDFDQCPKDYVSQLFDDYAPTYDQHLTQVLKYNGHEKLAELLQDTLSPKKKQWERIADLGCGTGLAGDYLKPWTKHLIGVDCSNKMLYLAKKTNHYDDLLSGFIPEITWPQDIDVFFLADCLPYLGDLDVVVKHMVQALNPDGYIACSIESAQGETETFKLTTSGRFIHHSEYLVHTMAKYGCQEVGHTKTHIRYEQHNPVNNELFIFKKY